LINGAGVIKIVKLKLRFSIGFCSRKQKSQPFPLWNRLACLKLVAPESDFLIGLPRYLT
jgi:hypothetical protein